MNFAAKVVCKGNFKKCDHATPLLEKLSWTPIQQRFPIRKARYVFSSLYLPQSKAKTVNFLPPNSVDKQNYRRNDVLVSYRSSNMGQKALSISGALLLNNLPAHVKKNPVAERFQGTPVSSFRVSGITHICMHIYFYFIETSILAFKAVILIITICMYMYFRLDVKISLILHYHGWMCGR
jgi:hypothetical protein